MLYIITLYIIHYTFALYKMQKIQTAKTILKKKEEEEKE